MSTVVSNDTRRFTIVNLKQVNELPLRNALQTFDKNGDGKIDITELQKIIYWYGLWKYASFCLCLIIMTLVWCLFGLTIWAINLTKEYTVTDGVLTGGDEVVKMSVASTYIPLSWASLLDRRHLDSLESISIDVAQNSGKFTAGVYHVKLASYLHANSTYLKLFGTDGSIVWVNSGTVVLLHPDADEAIMVCGAAACNTLAVDVKPEYLEKLVQRSVELFASSKDFELPAEIDGVAINKAAGENSTCLAWMNAFHLVNEITFPMVGDERKRANLDDGSIILRFPGELDYPGLQAPMAPYGLTKDQFDSIVQKGQAWNVRPEDSFNPVSDEPRSKVANQEPGAYWEGPELTEAAVMKFGEQKFSGTMQDWKDAGNAFQATGTDLHERAIRAFKENNAHTTTDWADFSRPELKVTNFKQN